MAILSNIQHSNNINQQLGNTEKRINEECSKLYYEYNFSSTTKNYKLRTYVTIKHSAEIEKYLLLQDLPQKVGNYCVHSGLVEIERGR